MFNDFRKDEKGQWMPILQVAGLIAIIGIAVVFIFITVVNQPLIGGGAGVISQWCTDNIGNVVPAASGLCAGIPFQAIGTLATPPAAPIDGGLPPVIVQTTSIAFTVNPVEQFLAGTRISQTITCSRTVGGFPQSDINSSASATLPVGQNMDLLCGKDTGSGTDYYNRQFLNLNSGTISPNEPTFQFTREGTLTHSVTNPNGITANASGAAAVLTASQTIFINVKTDNTTSNSCYGSQFLTKKVNVTIDANYAEQISRVTPFGIASFSGATAPPLQTLDTNNTAFRSFDVPALNLCDGNSKEWKLKIEALSSMTGSYEESTLRACFYDYTMHRNTETGLVGEHTFNPVTNADLAATDAASTGGSCLTVYYDDS